MNLEKFTLIISNFVVSSLVSFDAKFGNLYLNPNHQGIFKFLTHFYFPLFLIILSFQNIQAKETGFLHYLIIANENKIEYDDCLANDSLSNFEALVLDLANKIEWKSEDIVTIDSLLYQYQNTGSDLKYAIICYFGSLAYAFFDQEFSDSLAYRALRFSQINNDIEGQIFCLKVILDNSYYTYTNDSMPKSIEEFYELIFHLKSQTNFYPAKLAVTIVWLNYLQLKHMVLMPDQIDSIYLANIAQNSNQKNALSSLLVALGIKSYAIGLNQKSVDYANMALGLVDSQSNEYCVYLYNLGFALLKNNEFDSALKYLHTSVEYLPNSSSIYFFNLYRQNYSALAEVHYKLNNIDSLYYYSKLSNKYLIMRTGLEVDERRAYAFKILEFGKLLAEQEKLVFEKKKMSWYMLLLATLGIGLLLIIVFLFKLVRLKSRLASEKLVLAQSREQLVNIITHDLSSGINSLITYLRLNIEFKDSLPVETMRNLEKSFSSTASAIQITLNNIGYWGLKLQNRQVFEKEILDFDKLVKDVTAVYSDFAALQNISLEVKGTVGFLKTFSADLAIVIRNLVNNAIKHGVMNSVVNIDYTINDKYLFFSVTNLCLIEDKVQLSKILPRIQNNTFISSTGSLGGELIGKALNRLDGTISLMPSKSDCIFLKVSIPIE